MRPELQRLPCRSCVEFNDIFELKMMWYAHQSGCRINGRPVTDLVVNAVRGGNTALRLVKIHLEPVVRQRVGILWTDWYKMRVEARRRRLVKGDAEWLACAASTVFQCIG